MADPEVVERLDLILAVLQLAHQDAIERAGSRLRSDEVNSAILEACADDWIAAGKLKSTVMSRTKAKDRTVRGRIAALTTQRAIQRRGGGSNVEYRSMGLV
jgi:hypothetical protein